jgi:hypothetical protein
MSAEAEWRGAPPDERKGIESAMDKMDTSSAASVEEWYRKRWEEKRPAFEAILRLVSEPINAASLTLNAEEIGEEVIAHLRQEAIAHELSRRLPSEVWKPLSDFLRATRYRSPPRDFVNPWDCPSLLQNVLNPYRRRIGAPTVEHYTTTVENSVSEATKLRNGQ